MYKQDGQQLGLADTYALPEATEPVPIPDQPTQPDPELPTAVSTETKKKKLLKKKSKKKSKEI